VAWRKVAFTERIGLGTRQRLPSLSVLGLAAMALGIVGDVVEHTLISHRGEFVMARFPLGQHIAHLTVVVGMVVILAGIVIDGVRSSQGRVQRPRKERSRANR